MTTLTTSLCGLLLLGLMQTASAACPEGYTMSTSNDKCYMFIDAKMTYDEAMSACADAGGHMPTIADEADNEIICDMMPGKKPTTWLGVMSVPMWGDGSEASFTNYKKAPTSKACAFMDKKKKGVWISTGCDKGKYGVLCEANGPDMYTGTMPPYTTGMEPETTDLVQIDETILLADVSIEVISTDDKTISCKTPLALNVSMQEKGVGFLADGHPVYCEEEQLSICQKYNPKKKKWQKFGSLIHERRGAAVAQFPDGYVLIAGGIDSSGTSVLSTEIFTPSGGFQEGPNDLPASVVQGCMTAVDKNRALLSGGGTRLTASQLDTAYMFDRRTSAWTQVDSMKHVRQAHACGMVGDSKAIAASGETSWRNNDDFLQYIKWAEFYDLNTDTWSEAPEMPIAIFNAKSFQIADTILVMGGMEFEMIGDGVIENTDKIFMFNPKNMKWVEYENTVANPGNRASGYLLPKDYFKCSP